MADTPKGNRRRGFKVGGQDVEEAQPDRVRPRSVDDAFRLTNKDEPVEPPEGGTAYPPHLMQAFLEGRITLGDLEGITKQEQYQMAEIGHGYLGQGKLAEAKIVFEGLLALDPFDAYFNMALASIAQQEHQNDAAEKLYTRALEINPFSPTAHANRGELRVMQGDLQHGVEDLVKAIELDPKLSEPATERAKATLMVLREQLAGLDTDELKKRAEQSTGSKIPAAPRKEGEPRAKPRPRGAPRSAAPRQGGARPRPRPRGRPAGRPGPRRPGPRRPGPRGPRSK